MSRWDKLPDEKRDHWHAAYEFVFVRPVSPAWFTTVNRFKDVAEMTDRLIVKAIELAHAGADGSLLAYTEEILSRWAAEEITTIEQYEASQVARAAAKEQRAQERAAANVRPVRKQVPSRSNVFLQREAKDDKYYDHIYKRFEGDVLTERDILSGQCPGCRKYKLENRMPTATHQVYGCGGCGAEYQVERDARAAALIGEEHMSKILLLRALSVKGE